jgi:ribonuclease Z
VHKQSKITFLGTSTAIPDKGSDTASFLINDTILVDTGWGVIDNLRNYDVDPTSLQYVIFTHLHHDHYMSLPSLLFYWMMKKKSLNGLKIIGPPEDLKKVVSASLTFLQQERFFRDSGFPELIELLPGDTYEQSGFKLETCGTIHPVQGLCYRFNDYETGQIFSFTGDTAFHPPIAEFVKGSSLLVTEASLGAVESDPDRNTAQHSGAVDAGKMAALAQVDKLLLIHGSLGSSEACVQAASEHFDGAVQWPKDGETIFV